MGVQNLPHSKKFGTKIASIGLLVSVGNGLAQRVLLAEDSATIHFTLQRKRQKISDGRNSLLERRRLRGPIGLSTSTRISRTTEHVRATLAYNIY